MSDEERLTNLEEFAKVMVQWTLRAEERMDELRAAQADSEAKIAALADAQIKTEEALTKLAEAQARAEQRLSEAQARTEQRLDALIDIVREMREGNPPKS